MTPDAGRQPALRLGRRSFSEDGSYRSRKVVDGLRGGYRLLRLVAFLLEKGKETENY